MCPEALLDDGLLDVRLLHVDRNTLRKVAEPTPNPAAIASEMS